MSKKRVEITLESLRPGFYEKADSCRNCIYSSKLPGTHHLMCSKKTAGVQLNPHGVKNGWAFWPLNFDPIWVDICDSFVPRTDEELSETDLKIRVIGLLHYLSHKGNALVQQENWDLLKELNQNSEFLTKEYTSRMSELIGKEKLSKEEYAELNEIKKRMERI